ncbi:MAG: FlgD immunoglobulin-like domain containing protein, partial [bacterium]
AWAEGGCGLAPYILRADGSGHFATIQDAIDAIPAGSVVLLEDGVYTGAGNRDINFSGKALTIRSLSKGAENCIIDCEGSDLAPHRAFLFTSGEGAGSQLENVTIRNGYANATILEEGGALRIQSSSPTITGCFFESNHATDSGGVVYCELASPLFSDCQFTLNTADYYGGVMYVFLSSPVFTDCVFAQNSAPFGGAGTSVFPNNPGVYHNCLFFANQATVRGGAMFLDTAAYDSLLGCTFFGNSAPTGGSIHVRESAAYFSNTIIAYGQGGGAIFVESPSGFTNLECCNLFGNSGGDWTGLIASQMSEPGNISLDPLFCDTLIGDFHLSGLSPCAADNNPLCGLIGAWPENCTPTGVDGPLLRPVAFRLHACYPNPFNPLTTIRFDLPRAERVKLTVYDLSGRQVRTVLDEPLPAGFHEAVWDGRNDRGRALASGVYLFRIEASKFSQSRRMVLLK